MPDFQVVHRLHVVFKAHHPLQLDTDPQPSVFDAVVAVDAGVDHLFRHGGVTPENVRDLVYGALFTRGPADLQHGDLHRRVEGLGRRGRP